VNPEVRRAVELAVSRLSPQELAERVAWCEEHADAEVVPQEPRGLGVDLHWGGKLLTTVHVTAIQPRMAEDPIYRSAFAKYQRTTSQPSADGASDSEATGPIMISANRAAADATPGGPPDGPPAPQANDDANPTGPPEGLP